MSAIDRYVHAATRDNTRRSYRSAITHFEVSWGGFLPATPDSVARYLADHAETLSVATLRQRLAALARWHRDQGFVDPTQAPVVRAVLKGIREEHPQTVSQARPLQLDQLQAIDQWLTQAIAAATTAAPHRLAALYRNRALILLGFWRAFRSDELCRLQIEDLSITPGAGMALFLRRSKGDRQAKGRTVKVPALQQCCPVAACQDWLAHTGLEHGPLFRRVDRWGHIGDQGLRPNSLIPLLRQVMKAAGLEEVEAFSSHSLRRGFATWAHASGWDLKALMTYVGWRDVQSALRYVETASPFEHALRQIPEATGLGQPRLAAPVAEPVTTLVVHVSLTPHRPRSQKHHRAREIIETHCLTPLAMERSADGDYCIQLPTASEEAKDERLYDLLEEIHHLAEDQACWVEAHITDPISGRVWD